MEDTTILSNHTENAMENLSRRDENSKKAFCDKMFDLFKIFEFCSKVKILNSDDDVIHKYFGETLPKNVYNMNLWRIGNYVAEYKFGKHKDEEFEIYESYYELNIYTIKKSIAKESPFWCKFIKKKPAKFNITKLLGIFNDCESILKCYDNLASTDMDELNSFFFSLKAEIENSVKNGGYDCDKMEKTEQLVKAIEDTEEAIEEVISA